ncbi:CLUMA_CG014049, isoform A [Clunio marinus]|uniref:CLUMA_CG014049, isoform A n=1 Tax=Clunio marinus TaxID=568069 RepID=A0A1J1IKM8_9DIPT|nr:CLUMA_CG014049, isoform A [Clunio marinus]
MVSSRELLSEGEMINIHANADQAPDFDELMLKTEIFANFILLRTHNNCTIKEREKERKEKLHPKESMVMKGLLHHKF